MIRRSRRAWMPTLLGALCVCTAPSAAWAADSAAAAADADKSAGAAEAPSKASDAKPSDAKPSDAKPSDAKPAEDAGTESGTKRTSLTRELAEQGEADLFKSVRVFQQRFLVKASRVELQLGGGASMADPLYQHYGADADLLFHINEHWAIGAGGSKWWGKPKQAFEQVQSDFGLYPEKSLLQAGGHGYVEFSPVVGKFAVFGQGVLQIDGYGMLGGGAARTTRGESLKPYGLVGVGLRFHAARWVSVSLELRDLLVAETFLNNDTRVLQQVFGGIKLGFWLPPTVHYKYPR